MASVANQPDLFGDLVERLRDLDGWDCVVLLRSRAQPEPTVSRTLSGEALSDTVSRFIDQLRAGQIDGLHAAPGASVDWYSCYRAWCSQQSHKPVPLKQFVATARRTRGVAPKVQRFTSAGAVRAKRVIDFDDSPPEGLTRQEWLSEVVPLTASMIARYRRRAQ